MSGLVPSPTLERAAHTSGVDVIVVNYRTPGDLHEFLCSYRDFMPAAATLWVVNVCPDVEDAQIVERMTRQRVIGPDVMQMKTEENIGFNRAVNRAGSRGSREYIAVFNADVVLTPNAIDELVSSLAAHPEWGIVGPRQVDQRGLLTAPGIIGTNEAPQWRGWKQPGHDGRFSDVIDDCVVVLGSAFVLRRSLWEQMAACSLYRDIAPHAVGPLLPCAHYFGETALSYHVAAHGHRLAFKGDTTVVHKWHRSSPVGGYGERNWEVDQAYFRRFCDHHEIGHD